MSDNTPTYGSVAHTMQSLWIWLLAKYTVCFKKIINRPENNATCNLNFLHKVIYRQFLVSRLFTCWWNCSRFLHKQPDRYLLYYYLINLPITYSWHEPRTTHIPQQINWFKICKAAMHSLLAYFIMLQLIFWINKSTLASCGQIQRSRDQTNTPKSWGM